MVGILAIRVNLRGNRSLKEKRRVIRRAIERTRAKHRVSVAEVGDQDAHQTALLGVAYVSNEPSHVDSVLDKTLNFMAGTSPEAEFHPEYRELLHF